MDFSDEEAAFIRKQRTVVQDLIRFAREEYQIDIDAAVAEDVLLDLLKHSDMDILFASREIDTVLPEVKAAKKHKQYLHILRRYIIYLHGSNFELFRYLADMALGHVIASAIVIEDYDWSGETVKNCNFYLDTPLIFKLLGADGPEQAMAYSDFFTRVTASGGKLWIFHHTRNEVTEILENSRRWVNSPNFDPERASRVTLYFRQAGFTDTDVEKFIIRLDTALEEHKVSVCDIPPFMEHREYQIDEEMLQGLIEKVYAERDPLFDKSFYETRTRRDVASISAVYRFRGNNRPKFLRQAKHAFLTSNAGLVLANRKYLHEKEGMASELPACLTDVFVGTVLWMNSPPQAKQDSRSRLLADCYAAVRPDSVLEKQLIDEAKKLRAQKQITKDDFVLLSTSFVTRDLLSDSTLNDREAFNTKTLLEILKEIKERIRAEAIAPYVSTNRALSEQQRQAQIDRDRALSALERIIDRRAVRRARLSTALYGGIITAGILGPLIPALLVSWYFLFIAGASGMATAYLSFFRGFNFRENHIRVYRKVRDKLSRKLLNPQPKGKIIKK